MEARGRNRRWGFCNMSEIPFRVVIGSVVYYESAIRASLRSFKGSKYGFGTQFQSRIVAEVEVGFAHLSLSEYLYI